MGFIVVIIGALLWAACSSTNAVIFMEDSESGSSLAEGVVSEVDVKGHMEEESRYLRAKKASEKAKKVKGPSYPPIAAPPTTATISTEYFAAISNLAAAPSPTPFPEVIQPLSFVVFYQSDGTGYVEYSTIEKQVTQLNYAFSGEEAKAEGYAYPTDSKIRFQIAGVRYVENDDYFNECDVPTTEAVYRPIYQMDPSIHLNIYICWCEYDLGLAWIPYQQWYGAPITETGYQLGAIVHWQLLPGNDFQGGVWSKGNIMTHEVGHTFGLLHPYQGDCAGTEANSDGIVDTPRMSGNPLGTCPKGLNSCPKLPGNDDISNYMIATSDDCRNHFTPTQVAFMQQTVVKVKPTLLKQLLPWCVAAVDSTDCSPDLQPCVGGVVHTTKAGKQWCYTDPTNSSVWAWACCPSNYSWGTSACWQGTPNFDAATTCPAVP